MILGDTNFKIEKKLFDIFSRMNPSQRLQIAFELSDNARDISFQAFGSANPRMSAERLKLRFLERVLGWKLPQGIGA